MSNAKILVIGNGFDLYHGLKTKYIDFVNYSKELMKAEDKNSRKLAISNSFVQCFIEVVSENQSWIDCEKEIEIVVTMMLKLLNDKNVFSENTHYIDKHDTSLASYEFERLKLMSRFNQKPKSEYIFFYDRFFSTYQGINKSQVMDTLLRDLNDLIKIFEMYLKEKVSNDSVAELSKQIDDIKPDYVISFNYTNTYELYGINRKDVCHIHGSVQDNNMVLGIRDVDEKNIDSVYFKKFFQRIQKRSDVIQWDKFGSDINEKAIAYFFGHSLSNNDGDLINDIYKNSHKIIIFYLKNSKDYEQKVINLIDTLGKEVVIQGINSGKIAFEPIKNTIIRVYK